MAHVTDNTAQNQYELAIDGHVAFARYRREDASLYLLHVEAPPELRGTGAAGTLMEGIMGIAKQEGLKVIPICGYAAAWMKKHP